MTRIKFGKFLVAAIAVAVIFAMPVSAASVGPITTTAPIVLQLTELSNVPLPFPQFDPALGTLLSVELDLAGGLSTVITVQNSDIVGSTGTAKTDVAFSA